MKYRKRIVKVGLQEYVQVISDHSENGKRKIVIIAALGHRNWVTDYRADQISNSLMCLENGDINGEDPDLELLLLMEVGRLLCPQTKKVQHVVDNIITRLSGQQ